MRHGVGVPALNDDEAAFLAARAAASGITDAMAASAVEEVTGRPPSAVERFAGGWGAVPFWATAADGTELVVRVGLDERPYEAEAAVLAHVRRAGIPVPEVVGVCRVEGRPVSVLVRAAGVPVSDLAGAGDAEARCFEAGDWLARIHRIDTTGLALAPHPVVDDVLAVADGLLRVLPVDDARVLAAVAPRLDVLHTPVLSVLCHHDFGADHVLVADGRVTAIIDWEWAARADPAKDVAWWQVYDEELGGGAAAVRRGYGPPDDAFDARVQAWTFAICINAVHFRMGKGDPAGVAAALLRARELLGAIRPL